MDFKAFNKWHKTDKKIKGHLHDLSELLSLATERLDIAELESIQEKMGLTLEQGNFWLEQNNIDRFVYDLEGLSDSICELIEKKG